MDEKNLNDIPVLGKSPSVSEGDEVLVIANPKNDSIVHRSKNGTWVLNGLDENIDDDQDKVGFWIEVGKMFITTENEKANHAFVDRVIEEIDPNLIENNLNTNYSSQNLDVHSKTNQSKSDGSFMSDIHPGKY